MKYACIIPAAGSSQRMLGIDKLNIRIGNKTCLEHSIDAFGDFDQVIVVGRDVIGGKTRTESVYNGIKALRDDIDYVLIHDGARPYVTKEIIERVKSALQGYDAVIPCVKPKDSIRTMSSPLDRDSLYLVQTPQGFKKDILLSCYEKAIKDGFVGSDDAAIVEHYGYKVHIVDGEYGNIKITTRDDIKDVIRFGNGYDLHLLEEGRDLFLACTKIPFEKGLLGHSDADVIAHAVCDAMLGAAALGDIGKHFPDNSEATLGMSGERIIKKTVEILEKNGFTVQSVDATLVAQKPKVAPYILEMRNNMARALGISIDKVSVKATTEEGVGLTGLGLAMAAYATAVVKENY